MATTTSGLGGTGPGPVRVFVSHSHLDKDIVAPLVELLRLAFSLGPGGIRATSVDGTTLPVGSEVAATIVSDLGTADVALAIITPASLRSSYVRFELETRSGRLIMPIVGPGVSPAELPPQLKGLHWVPLVGGIRPLLESVAAALGVPPVAPSFVDEQRSLIDRLVERANRLYTQHPVPLSFEATFAGADSNPGLLWSRVVLEGAERLRELMADGDDVFEPDLVLALNQGGMATTAMLKRWMKAPVGVAFTELRRSRRVLSLSLPDMSRVRRILLVDTKLKSGDSALNVMTELLRSHAYEFHLAALVAYGAWGLPRWTFPNGVRWPATFGLSGYELPTYATYHTSWQGRSDPYPEPWRNDILVPDADSSG